MSRLEKNKPRFAIDTPAKINLSLKVLRRRDDGYHELDTLFEAVSLADTLEFERKTEGIELQCLPAGLPEGPENLVWRAAELLLKKSRKKAGARITLHKRIPVGAGLGGGSSDAAAALLGLNRLWGLGFSRARLMTYAAELGSDVPFFVLGKPYAMGRGRGEKLYPVNARMKLWHVLVTPPFQILTGKVYAALTSDLLKLPGPDAKILAAAVRRGNFENIRKHLFNTLEYAVIKRYPEVLRIGEDLVKSGAKAAMVSGSGSTVFGLLRSGKSAEETAEKMRALHPKAAVHVVSTANL